MSTTTLSEGQPLTPGMTFPDLPCTVTREQQAEKLACCGLDPALHGDRIDITQLAYTAIMAVRNTGFSINGRVHMSQVFDLHEPLLLGEPLICRGSVISVTPDHRGYVEESRFDFLRTDGSIPLSSRRSSLMLDARIGAARKSGGAPQPAPSDPRDGLDLIARHRLVPDKVAAYSDEAENLIHSDPETAKRFGFRAPIAAGLMAVHFMMAALCQPAPPDRLKMSIRFRRPMFWDDALEVWGKRRANGRIAGMSVINGDGKVANDAVVEDLGYAANG